MLTPSTTSMPWPPRMTPVFSTMMMSLGSPCFDPAKLACVAPLGIVFERISVVSFAQIWHAYRRYEYSTTVKQCCAAPARPDSIPGQYTTVYGTVRIVDIRYEQVRVRYQ